jgi:two-component system, chemotaxis family, response regulator Rcp1
LFSIAASHQFESFPILIADDDSDDRFLLEHRLRTAGVQNPVIDFHDGDELVEFFEQFAANEKRCPCLLLLDLKMPMRDGFDVLTWLRERPGFRDLPVAVITSSPRPADRQRAIESGASEYFEKFPTASELAGVVNRASAHPFLYEKI